MKNETKPWMRELIDLGTTTVPFSMRHIEPNLIVDQHGTWREDYRVDPRIALAVRFFIVGE